MACSSRDAGSLSVSFHSTGGSTAGCSSGSSSARAGERSGEDTAVLPFRQYLLLRLFFFNDPPTTEIYTLSLHDALPIWVVERIFPLDGRLDGGLLFRLVLGATRVLGQRFTGQHEEIILLRVEDYARERRRFAHGSRLGNTGRGRRLVPRFGVGPRRIVFGIGQTASTARAAATTLSTAAARAPATPVTTTALIATAVAATIGGTISATVTAPVGAPIPLESRGALHGARRRRQRRGRGYIHGHRLGICRRRSRHRVGSCFQRDRL